MPAPWDDQPDAEVERRHRQIAERRDQAIDRSRTAMWRLVEAQQRQRETADEFHQGSDEAQQFKLELRDALTDAAIAWLEEKWGYNRPCPYCGNDEWTVSTPMDEFLAERGPVSAHFEVTCDNCGNTAFINAFKAGLLPERDELDESPMEEIP